MQGKEAQGHPSTDEALPAFVLDGFGYTSGASRGFEGRGENMPLPTGGCRKAEPNHGYPKQGAQLARQAKDR